MCDECGENECEEGSGQCVACGRRNTEMVRKLKPVLDASDRCFEIGGGRLDAAADLDWGRFDALGRELRDLMRQCYPVRSGGTKPLIQAWLDHPLFLFGQGQLEQLEHGEE